jgi:hypothetical protein
MEAMSMTLTLIVEGAESYVTYSPPLNAKQYEQLLTLVRDTEDYDRLENVLALVAEGWECKVGFDAAFSSSAGQTKTSHSPLADVLYGDGR